MKRKVKALASAASIVIAILNFPRPHGIRYRMIRTLTLLALLFVACSCESVTSKPNAAQPSPSASTQPVGPLSGTDGAMKVPTGQLIHPAGQSVEYHGRPIDLALSRDSKTLFVKDSGSLLAIDTQTWKILHQLKYPPKSGASLHGLITSRLSNSIYVTTSNSSLHQATLNNDQKLSFTRSISLKRKTSNDRNDDSYPCGIALSKDEQTAYVCLNTTNELAIVPLSNGQRTRDNGQPIYIPTALAPYAVVLSPDEKRAYVSNWAGRRPTPKDQTSKSAGTDVVIDNRGIASTGSVSILDLTARKTSKEIPTGLHPGSLALTADGKTLYVTNANSDTITVIDTAKQQAIAELPVYPDKNLNFGSLPNAIHLSKDNQTLYTANGGNNAVALFPLHNEQRTTDNGPTNFIPTAWFPSAVAGDDRFLYIASAKGLGSRDPANARKWNSHNYWGTIQKVPLPDAPTLEKFTAQVRADAQLPQALAALERSATNTKPTPIPKKLGEPSTIKHILYIIKENRTYDQVLGDIKSANGEESLCTFGARVTPNHHAISNTFVLLDNYYCNGVNSADGHAWVTEGIANDYLERSFGGFIRSYPFPGDDPMAFASSGFIWDNVISHGLSFRNFGEMSTSRRDDKSTWTDIYRDYTNKTNKIKLRNEVANPSLRRFSNPDSPGWNMRVTDQIRADVFIAELEQFAKKGALPNFLMLYLPENHTSGASPDFPTPSAMVADNDLALGRVVDAVSHSPFWKETAIFVIEDDPQAGFDHVDGQRSVCLVISPYTKRKQVVSKFYNQTSVLHTMERILALPPMNQMDAMSPIMFDCFTDKADLTPYTFLKNNIPLDEMNPPKSALSGKALELAETSLRQRWDLPDAVNDDELNRIVWHATKGVDAPYPAEWAGAHGRGLKNLHLKLDPDGRDDDSGRSPKTTLGE